MKKILMVLITMFLFIACGEKSVEINKTGQDGFNCFPNDTCNTGLVCVNDICEKEVTDESLDEDITDDTIDESLDEDTVDNTWILINGDYWLKEESLIIFNYDSTGINDIFDVRTMLQSKCDEIGGRLPSIDDFRKNITDPAFENFDMSLDTDDCPIYSDTFTYECQEINCNDFYERCNNSENTYVQNKKESEYFYIPNYKFITETITINDHINKNSLIMFNYMVEDGTPYIKETMSIRQLISAPDGYEITLTCIKK